MDGKQIETFVSGRGARLSLEPHFYPLIISVLDVLRIIVFESKKTRLFSHSFFVRAHASCHKCPGGVGTPFNGLYGEAPPERGTFFRLQVYKRVGISQV